MFGRSRSALLTGVLMALLLLCSGSGTVRAENAVDGQTVEGHVLSIEGADVIVHFVGPERVAEGDVVELWRSIELVHPVTRKRVRDRYRVGALKIVQVRERFLVGVPDGEQRRPPQAGDTVILRRNAPNGRPPAAIEPRAAEQPTQRAAPAQPVTPSDDEAAKVAALFESLKEASLIERIRAYIDYAKKNPDSPYAPILREDAVHYHRLLRAQREPVPFSAAAMRSGTPGEEAETSAEAVPPVPHDFDTIDFEPPVRALPGRSFDIGIRLAPSTAGAVLHVRSPEDVGYRPLPMARAGSGHFRATIPAERIHPPGVQYFIEGVDPAGRSAPVQGTDDRPLTIEVERDPDSAPPTLQRLTTVSVATDWADYNRFRGNDRTFQTEGLLGMRFGDVGVRALRTGFGVYRGVGGSLEELDEQGLEPRRVGLTYGYLEGEFGIVRTTAIVARAVCGLNEDGVTGGALALLRIGSDLETNLLLGGEVLGGIGVRGITQLELRGVPRLPIVLRSEVTNQPAGTLRPARPGTSSERGEVGLRAIVQVGYELSPGLVVAARGSAQGRTIDHWGYGFGGGVSYSW